MTGTDNGAAGKTAADAAEPLDTTAVQLMQLMIRPEHFAATNKDLALALGVTPRRIQQIKQSPRFRSAFLALTERRLLGRLPAVDEALVASACKVGRDGAQDRKTFYQMTGRLPLPGAKAAGDDPRRLTQQGAERLTAALQRVEALGPPVIEAGPAPAADDD